MTFKQIVDIIIAWANKIIVILVAIAFIAMVWGFIKYVSGVRSGQSKEKAQLKNVLLAGVIGMFVITSLWGILAIIGKMFRLF